MFWDERTAVFLFQMFVITSPPLVYAGYAAGILLRRYLQRRAVRARLFRLCRWGWQGWGSFSINRGDWR